MNKPEHIPPCLSLVALFLCLSVFLFPVAAIAKNNYSPNTDLYKGMSLREIFKLGVHYFELGKPGKALNAFKTHYIHTASQKSLNYILALGGHKPIIIGTSKTAIPDDFGSARDKFKRAFAAKQNSGATAALKKMGAIVDSRMQKEAEKKTFSENTMVMIFGQAYQPEQGYLFCLLGFLQAYPDQRWVGQSLQTLSSPATGIDPKKGRSETDKTNLDTAKMLLILLGQLIQMDENPYPGAMAFLGEIYSWQYPQSEITEEILVDSVKCFQESARSLADNHLKAEAYTNISFNLSRYRSTKSERLAAFYRLGYNNAVAASRFLKMSSKEPDYPYAIKKMELEKKIQKHKANNLTGLAYNLYLLGKYDQVVKLTLAIHGIKPDFTHYSDINLLLAESAKRAAIQNERAGKIVPDLQIACMAAGRRAFEREKNLYVGSGKSNEDFCKTFNAYWSYLDMFGQFFERERIEKRYGEICPVSNAKAKQHVKEKKPKRHPTKLAVRRLYKKGHSYLAKGYEKDAKKNFKTISRFNLRTEFGKKSRGSLTSLGVITRPQQPHDSWQDPPRDYSTKMMFEKGRALYWNQTKPIAKHNEKRKQAINMMFKAIDDRIIIIGPGKPVDDSIILWTVGKGIFPDGKGLIITLIDFIISNNDNQSLKRWGTAKIKQLSDRLVATVPDLGETEIRKNNLTIIRDWINDLLLDMALDDNVTVGLLKYKADRYEEQYVQNDKTLEYYSNAEKLYREALNQADALDAKVILHGKISYLKSRFTSSSVEEMIEQYEQGMKQAKAGQKLLDIISRDPDFNWRYIWGEKEVKEWLQKQHNLNYTAFSYYLEKLKDRQSR